MSSTGMLGDGPYELSIQARPTSYTISLRSTELSSSFDVKAAELTVAPPVGGSFTGTMFGIYSFGRDEPVLDPADFWNIYMEY